MGADAQKGHVPRTTFGDNAAAWGSLDSALARTIKELSAVFGQRLSSGRSLRIPLFDLAKSALIRVASVDDPLRFCSNDKYPVASTLCCY